MRRFCLFLLLALPALSQTTVLTVDTGGNLTATGNLTAISVVTAAGVAGGTYTSMGSATGSSGQTCLVAFIGGGGTGATASVTLGASGLTAGATLTITSPGTGYTSAPATGALSTGTASSCSGTANVSTYLGLLLDSLASVQPGNPATSHVGMWFDGGTGGPDWPLPIPMGIDSSGNVSAMVRMAVGTPVSGYYPYYWGVGGNYTPTSTFEVYDPSASGTTQQVIKAGAAQSGNLLVAEDNSAHTSLQVASNGTVTLGQAGTYPGQLALAGSTSGLTNLVASATPSSNTVTLPTTTGTAMLTNTALVYGQTPLSSTGDLLALNSTPALARLAVGSQYQSLQSGSSGSLPAYAALPLNQSAAVSGVLPGANGGTGSAYFSVAGPSTAQTFTFPNATTSVVTIADSGTVTNTMLANNSITIQGSAVALGGSTLATTSSPQFASIGLGAAALGAASPVDIAPAARTSGSPHILTLTAPSDTTMADAELIDTLIDLSATRTFTGSTGIATQRAFVVNAPTYAEGSAQTIGSTGTTTMAINGMPQAGSNATLTNSYGLWIQPGGSNTGVTNAVGLRVDAPSGASGSNISADFLGNVTFAGQATITSSGKWARYDGVNVASGGMGSPPIYAAVSSTGNTASIGTTNLQCGGSTCAAGTYRATAYMVCTTAGSSSSDTLSVTIGWNDGTAARTATNGSNGMPANIICNTTAFAQGSTILVANGSNNITYAFALGATTGSPAYAVYVNLERLQ